MTEILLLGAGFFVGILNAVAGGGILLAFPIMLGTGLSPLAANATANIAVLPGLLSSASGYRAYIRKVPKAYLLLLIPCCVGAAAGSLLLVHTSSDSFEKLVPWLVLFAVALFAFQPYMHVHLRKGIKKKSHRYRALIVISIAALPLALYGGYFGAGFGFVMLAFLGFTSLHDIHQMNGIKSLASATIAMTALCVLLPSNLIDWRVGGIMAVGSTVGGYTGARLAQRIPAGILRIGVISIGLATAGYLVLWGL